jgi:hypothetical protein
VMFLPYTHVYAVTSMVYFTFRGMAAGPMEWGGIVL